VDEDWKKWAANICIQTVLLVIYSPRTIQYVLDGKETFLNDRKNEKDSTIVEKPMDQQMRRNYDFGLEVIAVNT